MRFLVFCFLICLPLPLSADPPTPKSDYIKVEVKGRLQSKDPALKAPKDGFVVKVGSKEWSLDLQNDKMLIYVAATANGRTVNLKGWLDIDRDYTLRVDRIEPELSEDVQFASPTPPPFSTPVPPFPPPGNSTSPPKPPG